MNISFTKRLWMAFGVIVGSIIVASVGLYILSGSIDGQAQAITMDKALEAQQTNALGVLATLKSDAPVAETYTAAMQKLLPSHDDLIGVPIWVNGLASSHGVSASFSFGNSSVPATASSPGTDAFSMTVVGPVDSIVAFVSDLETAPQFLLNVNSFDLTNDGSAYSLSLQGSVFSSTASS